jgi:ATP-dependent DNA ligase
MRLHAGWNFRKGQVVIVGFTAPRRSRKYFGALLFAVREGDSWKYAGRAGTGFDTEMLRSVHEKLVPLITDKKPIAEKVPDLSRTTWVKLKLVAEVKFTEWTAGAAMRHRCFWACALTKRRPRSSARLRSHCARQSAHVVPEGWLEMMPGLPSRERTFVSAGGMSALCQVQNPRQT